MMRPSIGLLLLLSFAVLANKTAAENTYSITMPRHLRPGFSITMVAQILRGDNPVRIEASLSQGKAFTTSLNEIVNQGQTKVLAFTDTIPIGFSGGSDFDLIINGFDSVTGEKLFENSTTDLEFNSKSISIFIQTDKAIYQPSQTVKFRAVLTNPDLLPLSGNVMYKIQDPKSNVLLIERNVPLVGGMAGSEFLLGKHATLGEWKLTYQYENYEESLPLTVEEYKLPKFEVKVLADRSFLHSESQLLSGTVSAKFTFGQPVKGNVSIVLQLEQYQYMYWGYREPEQVKKIKLSVKPIDGELHFNVSASLIKSELDWNPLHGNRKLIITAYVTDKNSLSQLNGTASVDLTQKRLKTEAIVKPQYIKPGLPYRAYIKVSEYDGTLLSDGERASLGFKLKVEIEYPFFANWSRPPSLMKEYDLTFDPQGIALVEIQTPNDDLQDIIAQVFDSNDQYIFSWHSYRFKSPSSTFLQVTTSSTSFSVGDEADLDILGTMQAEQYSVMLMARGKLITQETLRPTEFTSGEGYVQFKYKFQVTAEMSPSVYAVFSFIRDDGEIVADTARLTVQASFLNKVSISTSTSKTDTGTPVTITVNTGANSLVGLRGIDQSVNLLKEGNDITTDKILDDLEKYSPALGNSWPRFFFICVMVIEGDNVPTALQNTGVLVFTDAVVYSSQSKSPYYTGGIFEEEEIMFAQAFDVQSDGGPEVQKAVSEPEVRKEFPETWLWTDSYAGPNGTASFVYDTPDTITTWEISSFALSETIGLGVTGETSKVTVFRNFFLSVDVPPTMDRGEVLHLRVTVYNFFETDLDSVVVTLTENEWYKLNSTTGDGPKRTLRAPKKDGVTTVFPIRFIKVGLAKIMVKAVSELAGDAIEKTIVIKPEGITRPLTYSTVIDRTDPSEPPDVTAFPVSIPKDVVPDSVRISAAISGNVLSNALNNLGNLLKMPYGCGEQNMLNFAPDVFISSYLKKVGRLSGEVLEKSKRHIRHGYQNELGYQREDGSFSAFGNSDTKGSTWLTAFVMKCFVAAAQLEPDLVEESKVTQAVDFLLGVQRSSGSYREEGKICHRDMQGGVNSDDTMAAYVLIAMLEGDYFSDRQDVTAAATKTRQFLEGKVSAIEDTYTLAVVGYALAITGSEKTESVAAILENRAEVVDNKKFWRKVAPSAGSRCEKSGNNCPFSNERASASDVEVTAYVLLMLLRTGETDNLMPIIRWLIQQRGPRGGYVSTQDTVMAIQALAAYAARFADRERNIELRLSHTSDPSYSSTFSVNSENSLVLQLAELPSDSGDVIVTATGEGFADVQLNIIYNLPLQPRMDQPFLVDVNILEKDNGDVLIMAICSKINKERPVVVNNTGMFVTCVVMPSGYSTNAQEATNKNKNAKLVELISNEVCGYFDELSSKSSLCLELTFTRYAQISDLKPQLLKSFDYYKPDIVALQEYKPRHKRSAAVCDEACKSCEGCGGGGPKNMFSHVLTIVTFVASVFLLRT